MKLVILGGGGFRVPQVVEAVAAVDAAVRIDEVALFDEDASRLSAIRSVIESMRAERAGGPNPFAPLKITATTNLDESLDGANFIFCAIRVGGVSGRTIDERVALGLGVLGQETTGPGGLVYAMRTLPVMLHIAERVKALAPGSWFINFTNPAGIITEGMRTILGDRVVGICDTPIGLLRRAARATTGSPNTAKFDYIGLNHLGWLRSFEVDGVDRLPELLASDELLGEIEEARLMGFDWVRALGALPNEYLFYYYENREAVNRLRGVGATRGEYLVKTQSTFYQEIANRPDDAFALWDQARHDREMTYMAEAREDDEDRRQEDVEGGGYQAVALDLMAALATGRPATMILDVANGSLVPGLPPEAVVEAPCDVDSNGVHPRAIAPVTGHMLALMQTVKTVEQLTIEAVLRRDAQLAWKAIALHPLVDSVVIARQMFTEYRSTHKELAELFG